MNGSKKKSPIMKTLSMSIMASFVMSLIAGCIGFEDSGTNGPCEHYPDQSYLREKWGSSANSTLEGYDVVGVMVWTWGTFRHENTERPDYFIDWDDYSVDARPEIISDNLCRAHAKFLENKTQTPSSGTSTAEHIGQQAMDDLREGHLRQTGEEGVEAYIGVACCYILFEKRFYGAECSGNHETRENGSASSSCW